MSRNLFMFGNNKQTAAIMVKLLDIDMFLMLLTLSSTNQLDRISKVTSNDIGRLEEKHIPTD